MENKICEACNKEFTYDMKPGYPRKYCPECSAAKKAEYENKTVKPEEQQIDNRNARIMSQKDISIISQVMMKCMYYNRSPENMKEVYATYNGFVKILEENG